jgi:hypothetical protein
VTAAGATKQWQRASRNRPEEYIQRGICSTEQQRTPPPASRQVVAATSAACARGRERWAGGRVGARSQPLPRRCSGGSCRRRLFWPLGVASGALLLPSSTCRRVWWLTGGADQKGAVVVSKADRPDDQEGRGSSRDARGDGHASHARSCSAEWL